MTESGEARVSLWLGVFMVLVDVFLLKKYFAGSAIEKLPQTVILV
jgi:hypothetical protein